MAKERGEIRRCRKCGQPTVLPEAVWQHSTWGVTTNSVTREYRCQNCGTFVTLRSKPRLIGAAIAGLILSMSCVGIPILGWAWWAWKQEDWNPMVYDAEPVERRFAVGPPERRCAACKGSARVTRITAHRTNGIPTGTEYVYTCGSCNKSFTIESPWGMIFSSFAGGIFLLIGVVVIATRGAELKSLGLGLACSALSLFMLIQVGMRLTRRFTNPVAPKEG